MRADDEGVADGPSAAAVLAVAEGLRRRDPQLSAALAEHAARLCDDGGGRGEAELSSVLARRELDRPDEVAVRGVPALREAERDGRGRDAAVLRCTLADAALTWSDVDVARALLAPLASGDGLPEHVRLALAVARADLVAARGDVAAVDAVATEAEAFSATREERLLAHTDLVRARGRARRTAGDLAGARDLLERACREPVPDAVDGGRRRVLATGELVDVLVALGERAAAGEAAEPVLAGADDVMTALPLALLRCRTASGVHLPAGELDRAEVLARAAADGLAGRGHDRALAGAEEVLAAVAEGRGDLQSALAARTRAHHLDRQSLRAEAAYRVELALAVGYAPSTTVTASPAPELVGRRRARHDTVAARTNGTLSGASNGAGHGASNGTGHGASNGAGYEVGNGASNGSRNGATNGSRVGRHGGHAAEPGPPRPEEATPHGLSRILDEITADAGSDVGDELVPGAGAGPGRNGAVPSRQQPDEHRNGAAAPPRRVPRRGDPAPDPTAGPDDAEEYEGELRLTREDLLAEYGTTAPGRPHPRAGANGRPARPVGPPPTAWSFHGERGGPPHPDDHGTESDPLAEESAEPDGGARLADLLAEAMDAFRRAAPEQGSIDPTPSERRPPRWRAPR